MTPPSTLRLAGLAATALALFLMSANGSEASRPEPRADQTQMAYAFVQLADAQAVLASTRRLQHPVGHKLVHTRAVAAAHDSLAATAVRVAAAPVPVIGVRR